MILEKAYYQQNFQTGNFLFATYGLGALIEENETHQEVYAQLKERVYAQFRADNPHLEQDNYHFGNAAVDTVKQPTDATDMGVYENYVAATTPEPTKAQTVEEQIKSCTSISTLEKTYKFLIKTNPSWQAAYDETMERLAKREIEKQQIIDAADALIPKYKDKKSIK